MPRLPIGLFLLALVATACSGGSHTSSTPTPSPTPAPTPTKAALPALHPVAMMVPPAAPVAAPSVRLPHIARMSPTASPTSTPTALPSRAAATSTARPTPTPLIPTPTPAANPNLPPRIVEVELNEVTVHSGDRVLGRVRTSLNTASVEARLGGYSLSLKKVGAGTFAVSYTVPWIPFVFHGRYQILLIARNTAGTQTRRLIPIQFE